MGTFAALDANSRSAHQRDEVHTKTLAADLPWPVLKVESAFQDRREIGTREVLF